MRYAKHVCSGRIVDALSAVSGGYSMGRALLCPTCGGRVFLRSGAEREPHFAHYRGVGSPDCEQYHPSPSSFAAGDEACHPVDSAPESFELAVALRGSAWQLLLRLPEIDASELAMTSLSALARARVEISCADSVVAAVSALELRPGVGLAWAEVPPSLRQYDSRPEGTWPNWAGSSRWSTATPGLSAKGSLFRFCAGEWTRLRQGAFVDWGQSLLLVAHDQCPPPDPLVAEKADVISHRGLHWSLWKISLPSVPDESIEAWLNGFDHQPRPPSWSLRLLSVPTTLTDDLPHYEPGVPVVVELGAPGASATAAISCALGESVHTMQVTADRAGSLFGEILSDVSEIGTIEVLGRSGASESFEFIERQFPLVGSPGLRVRIAEHEWKPWSSPPAAKAQRGGDVEIDFGVDGVRVDIVVWLRGGRRRVRPRVTPREAERLLAELLVDATLVEIDAGNFGHLRIPVGAASCSGNTVSARTGLSGWLGAMTQATALRAGNGQVALVTRGSGQKCRVVTAPSWLRSLSRVHERKLR